MFSALRWLQSSCRAMQYSTRKLAVVSRDPEGIQASVPGNVFVVVAVAADVAEVVVDGAKRRKKKKSRNFACGRPKRTSALSRPH